MFEFKKAPVNPEKPEDPGESYIEKAKRLIEEAKRYKNKPKKK
jgi:hypothetical protein